MDTKVTRATLIADEPTLLVAIHLINIRSKAKHHADEI